MNNDRAYTDISRAKVSFAMVTALGELPRWLSLDSTPCAQAMVPADFLGVNVAPSDDPAVDDYIVQRLAELGITRVRMDYSYSSPNGAAERLLRRLLQENFSILLDLFPPLTAAGKLHTSAQERERWAEFLRATFREFGNQVELFEIGNTPNRGKWSGFSSVSIIAAWQVAANVAAEFAVKLAGPNVSDFEPLYNAAYLKILSGLEIQPDTHTDNLFVERVIEPEAYDHRVFGSAATGTIKLNLIKKARALQLIGRGVGADSLICTYTCWTSKRLARRNAWPEQKAVDYQTRYLVLAAASDALRRVYWGPLICNRDGLIDDSATDYPAVDQVSFYEKVRGSMDQFSITDGFRSLANAQQTLAGAKLSCLAHQHDGLSVFRAEHPDRPITYIAWCRDAQTVPIRKLLSTTQWQGAVYTSATGASLARPVVISEHPLFFRLGNGPLPDPVGIEPARSVAHLSSGQHQSIEHQIAGWRGAVMLRAGHQAGDLQQADGLQPERIQQLPELAVMRDVRNRLWNVADPRERCEQVTVKLNRVIGLKRFTYRFRPSKGRRHWNNACQMLRRGIATPLPVAYYERPHNSGIQASWYLCEFIPAAYSARDVYAAFRDGATSYKGLDKLQWLDILSGFVCDMHDKQIVHRDLSAGNLLISGDQQTGVKPMLIDIGRASIWSGPGSKVTTRQRLQDLMRICYKLGWQDRETFVRLYEGHNGASLGKGWRLPFHYYDYKQQFKKGLKGKRKKRTPRETR